MEIPNFAVTKIEDNLVSANAKNVKKFADKISIEIRGFCGAPRSFLEYYWQERGGGSLNNFQLDTTASQTVQQ